MGCMERMCGVVVRVYREINGGYILFLVWGEGDTFSGNVYFKRATMND